MSTPRYRDHLPQLENAGGLFLTDGGIETTLIFQDQLDLPCFAAFDLLKDEGGRAALNRYFSRHAAIARTRRVGFVLESPTWRANPDWGQKVGYSVASLAEANRAAISLMETVRDAQETARSPMVISGCIGPRGDGYDPGVLMSLEEAEAYHAWQIGIFAQTAADMVTAITMTNSNEAIGVARAAWAAGMPVAISFTVETDGRLPTGEALGEAIATVDAATDAAPAYYMINCAHPTHFAHLFAGEGAPWVGRLRGLRANASQRSHAELDQATDLDDGDPVDLGAQYANLRRRHRQLTVLGGCCGTDHRHIERICDACTAAP
ncbi:homocysteine S-methyltransferase family protein [Belnapia sp. T6]|uniref:Homocysteine S-methyltransferase family protein n=1 Tax=Belnapia mucosa TaxID=2804532 RepID=A0ABS1VC20_9PROT|nr:homocysteine S-methyltransferase family protein [Belnapia mucosa]MBL6458691.1 homocysteine S-methyltransferase family protein [Belnapia mucosa]